MFILYYTDFEAKLIFKMHFKLVKNTNKLQEKMKVQDEKKNVDFLMSTQNIII